MDGDDLGVLLRLDGPEEVDDDLLGLTEAYREVAPSVTESISEIEDGLGEEPVGRVVARRAVKMWTVCPAVERDVVIPVSRYSLLLIAIFAISLATTHLARCTPVLQKPHNLVLASPPFLW